MSPVLPSEPTFGPLSTRMWYIHSLHDFLSKVKCFSWAVHAFEAIILGDAKRVNPETVVLDYQTNGLSSGVWGVEGMADLGSKNVDNYRGHVYISCFANGSLR